MIVYLARDVPAFVMYCINGESGSSLLVESTYSMIREEAHTNVRFTFCDGHQLDNFKERSVDLEVEGMHYIEMHRVPHTYWVCLLQGAEISSYMADSMCPCENLV